MQRSAAVTIFQKPGENNRNRKTGNDEEGDERTGPDWKKKLAENDVRYLNEQPTQYEIGKRGLQYTTLFEILEQADAADS